MAHTIEDLRVILRDLRNAIEALEAIEQTTARQRIVIRRRIEEAKVQEAVIMARLAESGVKL
jgi:hypothetical protein